MLLVSAFRHLDRDNVAKRFTQRWRSLVVSLEMSNIFRPELIQWLCLFKKYWERGLQFVWKCHIIHSVLETQALLIFLEVIDEEN